MEGHLSSETLVAILILLIYTVSAPLFHKIQFHYLHESGMCMILGLVISFVARVLNPDVSKFFKNRVTLPLHLTSIMRYSSHLFSHQ